MVICPLVVIRIVEYYFTKYYPLGFNSAAQTCLDGARPARAAAEPPAPTDRI